MAVKNKEHFVKTHGERLEKRDVSVSDKLSTEAALKVKAREIFAEVQSFAIHNDKEKGVAELLLKSCGELLGTKDIDGKSKMYLESSVAFLKSQLETYAGKVAVDKAIAEAEIKQAEDKDKKRKDTIKKLDDSKLERKAAIAAAQAKLGATAIAPIGIDASAPMVKKKPGRPKKA